MNSTEPRKPLSIGAVLGDADAASRAWSAAIGSLALEAGARTPTPYDGICVNVIVHVTGRIAPLDFNGVEIRRFSKAKQMLVVGVALPHAPQEPVVDKRSVLVPLVATAVAEAEAYVVKRKLASGLPGVRAVIEALA